MNTKVKIMNPGNRAQANVDFEQSQGNAAPRIARGLAPFALMTPPKNSARGAPKAARPNSGYGFRMLRAFFTLTAAAPAVNVLPESNSTRVFVTIRNASTSAGTLLVGFGYPPLGIETCDFELVAGSVLLLDGNSGVPQDDIWLFSTAGALGSVSYGVGRPRRG